MLVVAAPTVVLASSTPAAAPAPAAGTTTAAPSTDLPVPPDPSARVVVALSCETIADVDTAQRALDDDPALGPVLDTDQDGIACEARWPRTPPDTGVLDDVGEAVEDVVDTLTGQCDDTGFDGVEPNVAVVGHHLQARFRLPLTRILGVGARASNPTSDHPRGLALDLLVGRVVGDQLAAYVLDHRAEFGVTYVIWRQRINYGSGWEPMEDRGGITANHYDHVHVSFESGTEPAPLAC